MANNYLQFSEALSCLTEEQELWAKDRLRYLEDVLDEEGERDVEVENREEVTKELVKKGWEVGYSSLGFDYSFDKEDGSTTLWFSAEDSGNPHHAALFVQEFLQKFRPRGIFTLTWAETCSSMKIGEFSGGAVVVRAFDIDQMSALDWANEKVEKYMKLGKVDRDV